MYMYMHIYTYTYTYVYMYINKKRGLFARDTDGGGMRLR